MRWIVTVGTTLAVLVTAATASAASTYNNYSGSRLVIAPAAGSLGKPVGLGMTEVLAAGAPASYRAAPLTDIKVQIHGVKLDAGNLPVCTGSLLLQNKTSPLGRCPRGSLIGSGAVHALLGPASDASSSTETSCNPYLNVFNGGPKKQVFYFYTKRATDCGGLTTGSTAPYDGTISYSSGNAVINIPLPPDTSTKVANQPGLYSSLIGETIGFFKTVGGKPYMMGVGCKNGTRPWSITYTATLYTGAHETQTVNGSSKC